MKKAIVVLSLMIVASVASANTVWTWWPTSSKNTNVDVSGAALGIGSKVKELKSGAEVSLFYSATEKINKGCQYTLMGLSKAQTVDKAVQVGFVTIADKAMVQVGLLCFNKNGFLPFFIFFNLDKDLFNK